MKKTYVVLLSVVAVGLGTIALAGITGSSHDFSSEAWTDEICVPCHVPHHAKTESGASKVLWNHEETIGPFTMYSPFATVRASRDVKDPSLGGPSKLCLSCHDGTIAVDNYGGGPATPSVFLAAGDEGFLSTDLRDDHPIGVSYPPDGTTGYNAGGVDGASLAPLKLTNWQSALRVECTSCHEPHDTTNEPFLRMSNTASALCLKCHNK